MLDWSIMTHNPFVEVTKDTTTLYASGRKVFLFLVDDAHPIVREDIEILPLDPVLDDFNADLCAFGAVGLAKQLRISLGLRRGALLARCPCRQRSESS